jgi:hypothetical protein
MAPLRRQTARRGLTALARDGIVAWRLRPSTRAGRASPAGSWEGGVAPQAWSTWSTRPPPGHPPPPPPPRRALGRRLAPRGGGFARPGDGAPGRKAIGQGAHRRHACRDASETDRTVKAVERHVSC